VILINLLPHREAKRRLRKRAFFIGLGASAAVGALIVGIWYAVLGQMTAAQHGRNEFLKAEIVRLEAQIKDIATLRQEIEALKARQKAVEDLQTDRNTPVYLLDELVKQTPEGVYLTSIKQTGQVVSVSGIAQTNERVSEMLRNTSYSSPWLERPELVEIKAANVTTTGREQRRLFEFQMRLSMKRPQAATPASPAGVGAPGRPAAAASAPPAPAAAKKP
jgi:type IV pilus assembly protein PilN